MPDLNRQTDYGKGTTYSGATLQSAVSNALAWGQEKLNADPNLIDQFFVNRILKQESGSSLEGGGTNPGIAANRAEDGSIKSYDGGVFQINSETFKDLYPTVYGRKLTDAEFESAYKRMCMDPNVGAKFFVALNALNQRSVPSFMQTKRDQQSFMTAAYTFGASRASKLANSAVSGGVFDSSKALQNYDSFARSAGSGYRFSGSQASSGKYSADETSQLMDPSSLEEAQPLYDPSGSEVELYQPTLVVKERLDEVPWYDTSCPVGNPSLKRVNPAWFEIRLDDRTGKTLSSSDGNPIQIRLNVSLDRLDTSMKHVINQQHTRTAFLLTFWGQEPDILVGSGSTGVFMNEFGLTEFMSVSDANSVSSFLEIAKNDYANHTSTPSNEEPVGSITTDATSEITASVEDGQAIPGMNKLLRSLFGEASSEEANTEIASTSEDVFNFYDMTDAKASPADRFDYLTKDKANALRVAAQDAFIELLGTFKNNGVIRFFKEDYNGMFSQQDQLDANTWSPDVGASTFQINSRNNDVMQRGPVAFRYKNRSYLGHFKSFSFKMDAEQPYQWRFEFTFQVLKSMQLMFMPTAGA